MMPGTRGDAAFREAFAHAAIGMTLTSLDGRYLRVNGALCRMMGYTEAELLGTTFQAITHPDDLETDLEYVRRLVAGTITHYDMEKRYVRRDGSLLPVLLSVALVREPDGTPAHFVSQVQDLTSQRRLEEERLAAERRLAELERQASMNLIAGSIAHDFNNLLASVIGFTTLAREHAAPGSVVSRCLDEIDRSSQRAADLAQQMLAYAGSGKFVVGDVDVAAIMRQAAQQALVIHPETRLQVESLRLVPPVAGDAAQIQQALVNLLLNACEAVRETGGLVRIGAEAMPDAGAVQIHVTDTGTGIDPAVQPRIFDPFFTTKFIGRGLGLSAALGIVRAHHGSIEVDSTVGVGTCMTVVIPRHL
jgi:two-component system, cell cycle sensor histidine kinase and response regulator CckA